MSDSLIIKSSRSDGELKFYEPKPPGLNYELEYCRVSLSDREIAASSARIYLPGDVAALFDDMAAHRRGWEGEKHLSSIEDDLAFSCTYHAPGQVAMNVTLRGGVYGDDWCVQAVIHVEAAQLEELAAKVRKFFHLGTQR